MATSSVSSTSNSTSVANSSALTAAATATAANRANAQKIMNTLSAGSGVDVNALAQSLVDAEKLPRQNELNSKINRTDGKVSGYSAISFALNALNDSFKSLKDQSGFTGVTASNSGTSSFTATASGTAQVGNHEIEVLSVAKPQRSLSGGFLSANYPLNGGAAMKVGITLAAGISIDVPVAAGKDTPNGVISSINAMSAKTGVKASLVNTGDKGLDPVPSSTGLVGPVLNPAAAPPVTMADYGVFSATFGTSSMSVDIRQLAPAPTNMASLAAAIQTRLRAQDTTSLNDNISVSVSASGGLVVTDARGRAISNVAMTTATNQPSGLTTEVLAVGAQGVSAKPFKIMLTGPTGAAQSFSLNVKDDATGNALSSLAFVQPPLQTASDASLKVNGISFTRPSNSIKDVVAGVTLDLKAPTPVNVPANVDLVRDTTPVKDKLKGLVAAYNDAMAVLNVVSDPKSTVEQFGATLVGDSTVRRVREQMRSMVTGNSNTPSNGLRQIWQFGVSLDQTGKLNIDEDKLESMLQSNFNDAVTLFTGNTDNLSAYSTQPAGLAGEAVKKITALTSKTGYIQQQSDNATAQITKFKADLTKLDSRMEVLLARYTKQFGIMNNLVGQTNSLKTTLKSTFDGMMSTYTNK